MIIEEKMTFEEFKKVYEKYPALKMYYSALGQEKCFMCKYKEKDFTTKLVHIKTTHGIGPDIFWEICKILAEMKKNQ